jgi:hypothetical protein
VLAENLIAPGRWTAADSALVAAERAATDPRARVVRGLWAMLPFLAVPRAQLEAIRADVAAWDPSKEPSPPGPANELLPQVQRYVLGLLASRLGEEMRRCGRRAARGGEGGRREPAGRALARGGGAGDVALGARRPADALKALEAVRGEVPLDLSNASPFSEDYARFLRGEALLGTGNDGEGCAGSKQSFTGRRTRWHSRRRRRSAWATSTSGRASGRRRSTLLAVRAALVRVRSAQAGGGGRRRGWAV